MNNAPEGLQGGHGQAGKPDMQKVNWTRKDLVQNPFTSPPPSLIFLADELYINWGLSRTTSRLFLYMEPLFPMNA